MIDLDKRVKDYLKREKELNLQNTSIGHLFKVRITNHPVWLRWKFIEYMRKSQFSTGLKKLYYERKKNKIGNKIGFEIKGDNIGVGLVLYHNGPIVINSNAIIGKNVRFHGDNCVGNNGEDEEYPVIGNNVDVGVGAKIIGKVRIANNVRIGAGAVVVKDCLEEDATLVGVPAKAIKRGEEK